MSRYYFTSGLVHFIFLSLLLWSPWMKHGPTVFMIDGFDFYGDGGKGGPGGGGGLPKEKLGQVVPQPVKAHIPAKPAPVQKATQKEEAWSIKDAKTPAKKETEKSNSIQIGEKTQPEKSNITSIGRSGTEDGTNYVGLGEGAGPGIGIGTGDGTGMGGSGFGYSSYLAIMRRKIWSEWTQSAVYGTGFECVVGLTVRKNGDVYDIRLEKGSGNSFYDNVAQRAVRNASPLPPLPSGFDKSEQRFRIKFVLLE